MHSNIHTIAVISIFAAYYLYFTIRETSKQKLDIYDLVMLSAVAVIPWLFVIFPSVADFLARISGVAFPFVSMFGVLFAIIFIFIHRLTAKVHQLEHDNRLLIQEVSALRSVVSNNQIKTAPIEG